MAGATAGATSIVALPLGAASSAPGSELQLRPGVEVQA